MRRARAAVWDAGSIAMSAKERALSHRVALACSFNVYAWLGSGPASSHSTERRAAKALLAHLSRFRRTCPRQCARHPAVVHLRSPCHSVVGSPSRAPCEGSFGLPQAIAKLSMSPAKSYPKERRDAVLMSVFAPPLRLGFLHFHRLGAPH